MYSGIYLAILDPKIAILEVLAEGKCYNQQLVSGIRHSLSHLLQLSISPTGVSTICLGGHRGSRLRVLR